MKKYLFLVFLINFFYLSSCKETPLDVQIVDIPEDPVLPLEVGNLWVYWNSQLNSYDTMEVISSAANNGIAEYTVKMPTKDTVIVVRDSMGCYYSNGNLVYIDLFPLGDTIYVDDRGYKLLIQSSEKVIDVPAGSFETIVFEEIRNDSKKLSYMAPNVGLIKCSYYQKEESNSEFKLKEEFVLFNYQLKHSEN